MDMKIISLFVACFISMVVAWPPRGRGPPGLPPGHGGPGGPFGPPDGPKGPRPSMLSNCTDYENKINEEMHGKRDIFCIAICLFHHLRIRSAW